MFKKFLEINFPHVERDCDYLFLPQALPLSHRIQSTFWKQKKVVFTDYWQVTLDINGTVAMKFLLRCAGAKWKYAFYQQFPIPAVNGGIFVMTCHWEGIYLQSPRLTNLNTIE